MTSRRCRASADTQGKAPKVIKAYTSIDDYGSSEATDFQNPWDWGARSYQTNNLDAALVLREKLVYLVDHLSETDPHTQYQKESEKAAASGYASLDSGTKVPTAQLGTGTASASTYLRGDRSWAAVAASGGELLISDSPSTPLVFDDLIQNEDQDDLVYADA